MGLPAVVKTIDRYAPLGPGPGPPMSLGAQVIAIAVPVPLVFVEGVVQSAFAYMERAAVEAPKVKTWA